MTMRMLILMLAFALNASGGLRAEEARFASNWWQAYGPDDHTVRLFHFGAPEAPPWAHLVGDGVALREDAEREEDLLGEILDMDADDAAIEAASSASLVEDVSGKAEAARLAKPVPEPAVPTDAVYDYSDARAVVPLVAGVAPIAEGRFGAALRFDGTGPGLQVVAADALGKSATLAECWVKVEALPKRPACIISMGGDQSRLMLLPNGRLEILRKRPYGDLREEMFEREGAIAELEAYRASDVTIRSDRAIPVGEWVHVAYGRGQTAVVNAYVGYLWIDGVNVARHQACKYNHYNFMVGGAVVLGNAGTGDQAFVGAIDEFRISAGQVDWGRSARHFNQRVEQPWIDPRASREQRFDRPYFLSDSTVSYLPLDDGLEFVTNTAGVKTATWDRPVAEVAPLQVPGVRGSALVMDPRVGLLRVPGDGLSRDQGSVEFWARPVNWDDNRSIPIMRLVAAVPGSPAKADANLSLFQLAPARGTGNEPGQPTFHPGEWSHFCVTWQRYEGRFGVGYTVQIYRDHDRHWQRHGRVTIRQRELGVDPADLQLVGIEFGVPGGIIGGDGNEAAVIIDEVVTHKVVLQSSEVVQAYRRAQQVLEPIRRIDAGITYRRSTGELLVAARSMLPAEVVPASATFTATDAAGAVLARDVTVPFQAEGKDDEMVARVALTHGVRLPAGTIELKVAMRDADGVVLAEETNAGFSYQPEPWFENSIGISDTVPEPWTPIIVSGQELSTVAISYRLGDDGLPVSIVAKGEDILARPVQLLEDGVPMRGGELVMGAVAATEVAWSSTFVGATCQVTLRCRLEYDGMIRFELAIEPTAEQVGRITLEVPIAERFARYIGYQLASGRSFEVVEAGEGLSSRSVRIESLAKQARKRKQPEPTDAQWRDYAFFTQLDVNDLERGLYWFADNARGWGQSDTAPSQEVARVDGAMVLRSHLVAAPMAYAAGTPIVIGMLPHPARPLPTDHRYFDEAPSPTDPLTRSITGSVFLALPQSPKGGEGMFEMFPRDKDWAVARRAGDALRSMSAGYRTMYLSIGYMKARAGAYDHLDWRNMDGSRMSLTPSFVDYIMWEVDQWLEHDIYDAFYLDDSYAFPITGERAVGAGQAVRLPNGEIQPGLHLWSYRELMKRWRQVMVDHGKRPMIMAHQTTAWMYPGLVFAETSLDGEGHPTITHRGGEYTFIDAIYRRQPRFKVVQNPWLWGVPRVFMPSIWGFGPLAKGESPHRKWAWRMARGAQGLLAHFENHATFYDEGGTVYPAYWKALERWGGLDPAAEFVPFFQVGDELAVAGQGTDVWASYYRRDGKVLVVVTNLLREPRDLVLDLDLEALGLPPSPRASVVDAGEGIPRGTDPYEMKKSSLMQADVDATVDEVGLGGDDLDVLAELEAQDAAEAGTGGSKLAAPRLEGSRLIVPMRMHDYRIIAIE